MRTCVLRVSQRANSRTITILASLEVDGHAIPNSMVSATATNVAMGMFDQASTRMLAKALRSAISSAAEPLFSGDLG